MRHVLLIEIPQCIRLSYHIIEIIDLVLHHHRTGKL
ncbi:unnamed protein product [Brugia timori]|uniref:Uncharacterized protein n=1 Tax=Brugia timori TaxID=42155 RepID=A0A0R3QEZ2_9BILA|nr:unnamed protein product [Brugia timori]